MVEFYGGGAGGSYFHTCAGTLATGGPGGGSGAYTRTVVSVTPGSTLTVNVGAAGAAGAGPSAPHGVDGGGTDLADGAGVLGLADGGHAPTNNYPSPPCAAAGSA